MSDSKILVKAGITRGLRTAHIAAATFLSVLAAFIAFAGLDALANVFASSTTLSSVVIAEGVVFGIFALVGFPVVLAWEAVLRDRRGGNYPLILSDDGFQDARVVVGLIPWADVVAVAPVFAGYRRVGIALKLRRAFAVQLPIMQRLRFGGATKFCVISTESLTVPAHSITDLVRHRAAEAGAIQMDRPFNKTELHEEVFNVAPAGSSADLRSKSFATIPRVISSVAIVIISISTFAVFPQYAFGTHGPNIILFAAMELAFLYSVLCLCATLSYKLFYVWPTKEAYPKRFQSLNYSIYSRFIIKESIAPTAPSSANPSRF